MKKYIALILCTVIFCGALTACSDTIKGGEKMTDIGGGNYAAVTKEDGNINRDEAGNIIVLVTDSSGDNVKGDDGEYVTNAVALDHALVVGNRIECKYFAMNIPEGWSNNTSYSDLIIKRNDYQDQIVISSFNGVTMEEKKADRLKFYNTVKETYANSGTFNERTETICDTEASIYECYVTPEGEEATPVYLALYFFQHNAIVYSCSVSSDRDLTGDKEIARIIDTIEFI